MFVNAEMIRSLDNPAGSPSRLDTGASGGGSSVALREGMKVEGNYRGKGRFFKGVIKRENRDGTFDVDYDDVSMVLLFCFNALVLIFYCAPPSFFLLNMLGRKGDVRLSRQNSGP